jgi:glutathione S-transferase
MPPIYKFLGNHKFIVGNSVTWLDFAFFELINLMVFLKPDLYDVYPNLKQYHANVGNLPGLKEYLAQPDNI